MIFEDAFYPDNPKRRQEVSLLQAEVKIKFESYKDAWNHFANIINPCFDDLDKSSSVGETFSQYKLKTLNYNLEKDVDQCIREINEVIKDAKSKLDKFVKDIGLEENLPNLSVNLEENEKYKIYRLLNGIPSITLSAFATYYTYWAVRIVIAIANIAEAAIGALTEILGGIFAGLIVGGAAFIVSDMIISAINGAIERKNLENAIDALKEFKKKVADPLGEAGDKLRGILQSIKDGAYILSDEFMLIRGKDGTYKIIERP